MKSVFVVFALLGSVSAALAQQRPETPHEMALEQKLSEEVSENLQLREALISARQQLQEAIAKAKTEKTDPPK